MALNQSNRLIRMTKGPLGPDEVVVTRFSGREAISRPFSFEIEFISTRLDVKPGEIVGMEIAIELDRRDADSKPIGPGIFTATSAGSLPAASSSKTPDCKIPALPCGDGPGLWFLTQPLAASVLSRKSRRIDLRSN